MGAGLRNSDSEFEDQPVSEINVTPLVDVMLVLLIVFMVAAPMMATGVPLELPKTAAKPLNEQKPPIAVSLDAAGKFFIGTNEVEPAQLVSALLQQGDKGLESRIHLRADKELPYGTVLELMGQLNAAGFTKVALVSQALQAPPAANPSAPGAPTADGSAVPSGSIGATAPVAAPSSSPVAASEPAAAAPPQAAPVSSAPAAPAAAPSP